MATNSAQSDSWGGGLSLKAWGIPYWQNQHRSRTEVDAPLSRLNSLLTLTSRTASGPQPDGSAELCSGDLNVHQLSFAREERSLAQPRWPPARAQRLQHARQSRSMRPRSSPRMPLRGPSSTRSNVLRGGLELRLDGERSARTVAARGWKPRALRRGCASVPACSGRFRQQTRPCLENRPGPHRTH